MFAFRKAGLLPLLLFTCPFLGCTQLTVTFRIFNSGSQVPPGQVYVAGSFNQWDPGKNGNAWDSATQAATVIIAGLSKGQHEFKITRGSWQTAAVDKNGQDLPNSQFTLLSDTIIDVYVAGWKDDSLSSNTRHTTSPNVHIIDSAFKMPQLGTTRRIWIYLPKGYSRSRQRYPVMYMHDGQNLFDIKTAAFGEWMVDELTDSLVKAGHPPCIIVGIDNGPRRLQEYNPWHFEEAGPGLGTQYVDFLVKTLKPYIDKKYRSLPDAHNTIIAGSSMGGLISLYAMLSRPAVFSKGGIFSPAFWTADSINQLVRTNGKNLKGKLFFYIGEQEGERHVKNMYKVTDQLGIRSSALIYVITDPVGAHNEASWRKWYPEFYAWVLAKGFNNIVKLNPD